ncbi:MAG TPA: hypothetical protein PKD56_10010, partial [Chitinophagales bacterium]|nr:hypothetical protein [Chitinophagales bacterium]
MEAESTNNIARPENEMIFWAMILANLSYGMLYAYIFGRWAGITNWMTGAQAGAIIGLNDATEAIGSIFTGETEKTSDAGPILFFTGAAAMVGSIP